MKNISENVKDGWQEIKKGWQILLKRSNFDKKVPFEITKHAIDEEKQDRELNREIKRYLLALDRKERIYHRVFSFLIFLAGVALFLYGKDKPDVANIGLFILGAALYGYAPEVFDKRNLSLLAEDEDKPQLELDIKRTNKSGKEMKNRDEEMNKGDEEKNKRDEESFSIQYGKADVEHKESSSADVWLWPTILLFLAFTIISIIIASGKMQQLEWIILGTITMFFISIFKRFIHK